MPGQAHRVAVRRSIGNTRDKLEELRGADYRVGDDGLIRDSCASFARKYPLSVRRSVPTTDSATWCHASGRLRRQEVAGRRLEELQNCVIFK